LILKVFAHTWTDPNFIVENDQKSNEFKTSVLDAFLNVESYYHQINSGNEKNDEYDCLFFNPFNAIKVNTALLFLKEVVKMDDLITVLKVIAFLFFLPFDLLVNTKEEEDVFVELCVCALKAIPRTEDHNQDATSAVRNILCKILAWNSKSMKKIEYNIVLTQLVSLNWIHSHSTSADREAWKSCIFSLCGKWKTAQSTDKLKSC